MEDMCVSKLMFQGGGGDGSREAQGEEYRNQKLKDPGSSS